MKMTLPQPQLVVMGMPWVVTVGTLGMANAFSALDHAVTFACRIAENGTRVALGHAELGWNDMFDASTGPIAAHDQTVAWEERMRA